MDVTADRRPLPGATAGGLSSAILTPDSILASPVPRIQLRPLTPDDGSAIAALGDQTPETGALAFHSVFYIDPYAALQALRPGTLGVAAEAPDHAGLVGLCLLAFGECWYEGALRPSAYLYSLSVLPAYRRMGIASQLCAWCIETARARFGDQGVIYAGFQSDNEGSFRTLRKWSTQRVDGRGAGALARPRTSPPRPARGLQVRPAEPRDLEEFARRLARFYRDYDFFPPVTAQSLSEWLAVDPPEGAAMLHHCYVAADAGGNLLAGACLVDESQVMTMQLTRMTRPLALANRVLRMVPADGTTRRLQVQQFWHAPERPEAGATLWESVRWLFRERFSVLMLFYDRRSGLGRVAQSPWFLPLPKASLVVRASVPISDDRLLYLQNA